MEQQSTVAGFQPGELEPAGGPGGLTEFLLAYPRRVMHAFRALTPVLEVPGLRWFLVLRHDEVREVLSNSEAFPVPWGRKMKDRTEQRNFVLGMPDGDEYRLSYRQLAAAFRREDVYQHVAEPAYEMARKILESRASRVPREFDAVEDLVTTVPARLCETYFGIRIPGTPEAPGHVLFAKWTLAISSYIFGPDQDASRARLALAAAENLTGAIRESIRSARKGLATGIVLDRLVRMREDGKPIDDDAIHAHLFGMVLGFIPTNVLAGGNILETLLRRPDFIEVARAAAHADDDELLWRCLREALRFRHINPGIWRHCAKDFTFASGWSIPKGSNVLALTQSAMFDPGRIERPHVFDPYRREEDYMVFGVGQHWCIGAYIAKAQLTQTFKPLLKLKRLEAVRNPRVLTTRYNGFYPLHLNVGFEP